MPKTYFALKLIPPRSSFMQDMTTDERSIMQQHVAYWTDLMNKDKVVAFGPVLDPKGGYGLGIVCVDDEEELHRLMKDDPANGLNRYEWNKMLAVTKET